MSWPRERQSAIRRVFRAAGPEILSARPDFQNQMAPSPCRQMALVKSQISAKVRSWISVCAQRRCDES
jgi:hypothetical protein